MARKIHSFRYKNTSLTPLVFFCGTAHKKRGFCSLFPAGHKNNEGHRLNAIRMLSHARYAFPLVSSPPHSVNRQTKHSTKQV